MNRWHVLAFVTCVWVQSAQAVDFVDFQAINNSGSPHSATGQLFGRPVTFSGGGIISPVIDPTPTDPSFVDFSLIDGSSTVFSNPSVFTPALPMTDHISFYGDSIWTIDFGGPILDPIIQLSNLTLTLNQFSSVPEIVSDNGYITFEEGTLYSSSGGVNPQGEATLRFSGIHQSLSFHAPHGVNAESLIMQFGANVPEPGTLSLLFLGGLTLLRRRRAVREANHRGLA